MSMPLEMSVPPAATSSIIDEADEFSWTYLEAAPASTEWVNIAWSNVNNAAIGTTDTAIGSGQANTNAIIAQKGHSASAAKNCADLSTGGYSDWFLPSKDELNEMRKNLKAYGIGGLGDWYWSSSEIDATNAWMHAMSKNAWNAQLKNNSSVSVRAIRAF